MSSEVISAVEHRQILGALEGEQANFGASAVVHLKDGQHTLCVVGAKDIIECQRSWEGVVDKFLSVPARAAEIAAWKR